MVDSTIGGAWRGEHAQLFLDPRETGFAQPTIQLPAQLPERVRGFGYLPDFTQWKPGDLLLFSALEPSFAQRQVERTQRRLQYAEEHARWTHAAVYIDDLDICEARPGGVRYMPVAEFVGPYLLRVRRDPTLSLADGYRIALRATRKLSRPYSYRAAATQFLRSLSRFPPSLGFRIGDGAVVCSQLFDDAYLSVTRRSLAGLASEAMTPAALSAAEDLRDVAVSWTRIAPSPPSGTGP